ncbi:unnamed protein product [Caenorhabditis auriculariae]|uniref:EGF-like domain-containing protein n=1 Tax=Caenorhabditis auriculariae TaxID=2777116 RepID=A0A8S1GRN8_9PELO|nr:unnamed protein product [Caenorhabditis auriculariae]
MRERLAARRLINFFYTLKKRRIRALAWRVAEGRLHTNERRVITPPRGSEVGINVPCNKELDGLLAADPDGNESAFMSCVGVGVGNIGFWERKICPNEMVFDFINQQCKTKTKKARKQQTLNIAILNNSCANGETCIGGSVCDLDSLKCMCPYGTIPQLDTLSCESNEPTFVSAPIDAPTFSFNSFGSVEKSPPNNGGFMPNNFNMPSQNSGGFQPNPTFKFNNFNTNTNNNNNRFNNFGATGNMNSNSNNNFQWKPEFSFKPNWNNVVNNNNNGQSSFNSFQPNTPQKFVFNANNNNNNNNNAYIQPVSVQKKISTLARPGDSCRSNEVCVGGSICTLPIGLCLCPGDLEERDGECVLPAASSIKISKVGIGALCSELAECDHGSSCVMGRCACLSPLVQHEGKCVLRQQQKASPGELCDNGEVCVKGSVCDAVIPVCVCPSETDLNDGECVRIASATKPTPVVPQVTQAPYRPPQPPQPVFTAPPTQKTAAPIMTMPPQPPQTQAPFTYYPQTAAPHTLPPATYKTTPRPQPPVFVTSRPETTPAPVVNYKNIYTGAPSKPSTSKPNHMKISLGGSKQAGVGVRCSLNTDCMIGAYCNGNTNPPSCQCLSTHVNIDGRCEKVVYPGQVGCRSDMQCTAAYTGTACIDRICVCPEGKKAVDQTCVPESSNSCGVTATKVFPACLSPYVCIDNRCVCPINTQCSKKRNIRDVEQSMNCWPGAQRCSGGHGICIAEKCHCLKGYVEKNRRCQKIALSLDSFCEPGVDPQCADGSSCLNGKCVCTSPDGCLVFKRTDEEKLCTMDFHCIGGKTCKAGRCVCPNGTENKDGVCFSQVGAYKNINSQCNSLDRCSGGSKCHNHEGANKLLEENAITEKFASAAASVSSAIADALIPKS